MKRILIVTAILVLTIHAAGCWADTGVGYSNVFSIDNNAAGPSGVPSGAASPYTGGATLLRGQLHCHSTPDKEYLGDPISQEDIMWRYRAYGYDFVALTNHNSVSGESVGSPAWQGWAPNSVEITHGNFAPYINDSHVLAVGTSQGTTFDQLDYPTRYDFLLRTEIVKDTVQRVVNVHSRAGLAFVAHPDSWPYDIPLGDLVDIVKQSNPYAIGLATPDKVADHKWNKVIYALGRPVWAYVEDDYHPDVFHEGWLASTWVAVPGSSGEWWGNIKEKLRNGNYYGYWVEGGTWPTSKTPPSINITTSGGNTPTISVTLSGIENPPPNTTKWLEFIGYKWGFFRSLATYIPHDGTYSYQCTGSEKFVRILVTLPYSFGTLKIASQPIMVYRTGYYTPYGAPPPGQMSLQSSSPELILRYLEPGEKPAPPPAGYIGDAFEVDTTDHQVPPDAVLQLSYDGEDTSPIGRTQYLAIYRYDTAAQEWVKVGGTVDPGSETIETSITALGYYCISADLPADTTVPVVFIDSPPSGGIVNADTTVRATVNDELGAWRVSFYMNDHLLAEDADALDFWTAALPVADYCEGDWTLKAVAEDLAGNQGTAEIPIYIHSSTPPPTITVLSPSVGNVLSGTVTATGTCGDNVAVAQVVLKIDATVVGYADVDGNNWTCQFDTQYLADGNRTLTATVEDYPGNTASFTVPVVISGGAPLGTVGSTRSAVEGAVARFSDVVVVADKTLVGDGFYVEALDRSSGVKIVGGPDVAVGDKLTVVGIVSAAGSEKVVLPVDILVLSSGNSLPAPIGIYGKRVLWPAPDSIGKRLKMWGNVIEVDLSSPTRWFVIDDGSGVTVKCIVPLGMTPPAGMVSAVGVCSVDSQSGGPVLIIGGASDIRTLW